MSEISKDGAGEDVATQKQLAALNTLADKVWSEVAWGEKDQFPGCYSAIRGSTAIIREERSPSDWRELRVIPSDRPGFNVQDVSWRPFAETKGRGMAVESSLEYDLTNNKLGIVQRAGVIVDGEIKRDDDPQAKVDSLNSHDASILETMLSRIIDPSSEFNHRPTPRKGLLGLFGIRKNN